MAKWKKRIDPMLCKDDDSYLTRKGHIIERKYDGTRVILFKEGTDVHLISRGNIEYTELYPELVEQAQSIKARSCILDGELAFFTPEGYDVFKPIHTSRQTWMNEGLEFQYMVFDILEKNGKDLKMLPLLERKAILSKTVSITENIKLVDFQMDYNGEKYFKQLTEKEHAEGVVVKPKESLYFEGSRTAWGKVKVKKVDTAWVVGYLPGEGARSGYFGSLVLAQKQNGKLIYVGRVGTGFNERQLMELTKILNLIPETKCPFEFYVCHEGKLREATFIQPKLKIRISFQEITPSGKFRGPAFEGIVG